MMASTSTADIQVWHEGDRCLAPSPRNGTLQEVTIQKLTTTSCGKVTALVKFTDQHVDDDEQEAVFPVIKLQRPDNIQSSGGVSDHEKPFFVYTRIVPGPSESLVLSSSGVAVPYTINRYLRGYQREGIQFIYDNYALSRGCILGDDMGLGKTVQVIGFLAAVLGKTGTWEDIENNRPQFLLTSPEQIKPQKVFLIVAPLSVLYNWKDELETWGHFRSVVVHGLRKEEELARIRRGRTEIALTTYETLRLSLDINWSAVIVDEAHKIKNPNSQITVAMKGLRCRVRVGLTGTILQNNLEELWCVMDWANPHCLGSLGNFKNKFSDPIELAQKHSATKRVLAVGRGAVRALARKLSHWFLRRTKSLIKEQLPKKDDKVVYCSLTSFQEAVYQEVLDTEDVKLLLRSSEKCDCHSRRTRRECCYKANAKGVRVSNLYFTYLTILRKVANHVALLQSTGNTSKKQEQYVAAVCEKVFQKFPDFTERCKQESFEAMSDPVYSGKMKVLQRLLKHYMQRKDKVLLFSLSTKLLDVLESYCMAEGLEYSRLDGNTKSRDRLKIVKDFNSCPDINLCLVSTMAGGLGLNFVGANVVVLFDPTWNPANDLQAIDRAYRIGQCRDVTVFRLISLGTVEEVIYLRQVYKQQLQCTVVGNESARRYFEAVQGADCQKGELFGIQNLFRLQTQGTCLTRKILEETGKVSTKDPCEPSNGGVISGVGASATSRGPPRRILDFSSEEDDEGGCKRKVEPANTSAPPGRLSLLQHGFSRLLQRSGVRAGSGESSQSEGEGGGSEEDGFEGTSAIGTGSKGSSTAGSGRRQTPGLTSNGGRPRDGDWDTSSGSEGQEKMKGERGDGQRERNRMPVALSEDGEDVGRVRTNIKRAKRGAEADADEDSPSSEGNSSPIAKSVVPRRHQDLFDSDESEDIDMDIERLLKPKALKRSPGQLRRRVKGMDARLASNRPVDPNMRDRHTEDIETFTSSDENHMPVKRGRSLLTPQTDTLTRLKSQKANRTIPSAKERLGGTIDTFLGGVQEVAYTHSNQHVVGGSKAEERLSRAALRDVFELHKYSQFPANELVGTQEPELSPPPQTSHGRVQAEREAAQNPRVDHPVTHASKSVHRPSRHTTVIIGETPGAIRRKQLENMACTFGSGSLRQFAEGVLRSTSAQRLSQLRQFYIKQGPELASVVRDNFPEPHTAQPKPDRTASKPLSKAKLRPGSKGNQKAAIEPQTEPRTLHRRSSPDPAISPPSRGDSSSSPLCLHHQPKSKPPPSPQAGRSGLPTSHRKGEAVEKQRYTAQASPLPSSTPNPQVLLTELLGDTSILDDLLRPRSKASSDTQAPPKLQSASPMPTPAGSRRDFWDILEEGNEERINRLTDLSEVERVCETSSVTARARGGRQEEESTSLWKKNQKFLWKK
uniref:Excision repair cross-complementation group 6-like 2 n=1 Tax=Esox lucius TaxID=8010 RepID=A0AAY5K3N0_ESOLU